MVHTPLVFIHLCLVLPRHLPPAVGLLEARGAITAEKLRGTKAVFQRPDWVFGGGGDRPFCCEAQGASPPENF